MPANLTKFNPLAIVLLISDDRRFPPSSYKWQKSANPVHAGLFYANSEKNHSKQSAKFLCEQNVIIYFRMMTSKDVRM